MFITLCSWSDKLFVLHSMSFLTIPRCTCRWLYTYGSLVIDVQCLMKFCFSTSKTELFKLSGKDRANNHEPLTIQNILKNDWKGVVDFCIEEEDVKNFINCTLHITKITHDINLLYVVIFEILSIDRAINVFN